MPVDYRDKIWRLSGPCLEMLNPGHLTAMRTDKLRCMGLAGNEHRDIQHHFRFHRSREQFTHLAAREPATGCVLTRPCSGTAWICIFCI
jgi:hypothetical protein